MTGDPTASTDVTDNSGFVDHLRLVHFTLLAACLIMWIAVSYQPPSSAARAYEQTNQLLHLKDTWDGGRWLRNFLSEQRAKTDGRMGTTWQAAAVEWVYPSPLLPVSEENRVQMIDLGNSHFVLANASIPTSMVSNTSSIDENTYSPIQEKEQGLFLLIRDSSSNLGNYIRIWNQLYSFHYLVHIEKIHGGWGLIDGLDPNHRSVKVFVTIEDSQVNTDRIRDPRSRTISPGLLLREDLIQLLRSGPYGPEKTDAIVAAVRGAGGSVELEPQSDPLKEAYEKLLQLARETSSCSLAR